MQRYTVRKDGSGFRVTDARTGIDHSARIAVKARAEAQAATMNAREENRRVVRLQTPAHRAMGYEGIDVRLDPRGRVTEWRLAVGGVWTTADLSRVQRMYDDEGGAR